MCRRLPAAAVTVYPGLYMPWSLYMPRSRRTALLFLLLLLGYSECRDALNRAGFIAGARKSGLSEATAERIWRVSRTDLERIMGQVSGIEDASADGWSRMSAPDIAASWRLNALMAARHPGFCAGTWTGTVDSAQLEEVLSSTTDDELRKFIRLQAATVEAARTRRPLPWSTPAEAAKILDEGWSAIFMQMTPVEQAMFERVMEAGDAVSSDEACAAARLLFTTTERLDLSLRVRFLAVLRSQAVH